MRCVFFVACLLLFGNLPLAAQEKIENRIVLIGNFYDAPDKQAFLKAVRSSTDFDAETIVLFLGSNTRSMKDMAGLRLAASVADHTDAKVFFVPGYTDWDKGRAGGYDAVLQQQEWLRSLGNPNIKFYPGDACPGPVNVDLKNRAELFIMDSQWWLHEHTKPDIESACRYRTKEEILAEIEDIVKDHFDKLVLFVTHHPVMNTGPHSGNFGLKQHIFPFTDIRGMQSFYLPLPVVGSLYPISRNAITTKQDMNNRTYDELIETGVGSLAGIRQALQYHPNVVFISAQEHSMQWLQRGRQHQIISGAASGGGRVTGTNGTRFRSNEAGFSVLEIREDKTLTVRFFEVAGDRAREVHAGQVTDYSVLPPLARDTTTMPLVTSDSMIAAVNKKWSDPSGLQRFLVGENYRAEWGANVKMKVLDINTEKGWLTITGMGGGHESKTLQMEDSAGNKWVLRSINKDLSPMTPEGFQETIADDIVHELLTGVHPYGALVVPGLQEPLDIVHASPEIVFVPNDTALGEFRTVFANTVGQLEERKPALNNSKTLNTNEAVNNMVEDSDHLADQEAFLSGRLVDFLISDFDRHHGQWSWGIMDTGGRKMYYPIPKDRDQALYHNEGFIMKIGRRKGFGFMTNFRRDIKKIERMSLVGAYMDMYFTNRLSEEQWVHTLSHFRQTLTDSVIAEAVHRLPPEIYAIRGQEIEDRMKQRRNTIAETGMEYYRLLSRKVNVLGGNKRDLFTVSQTDSGVRVAVYAVEEQGENQLRYERSFDPGVTREIRMYGFNENDYFEIDESVDKGIKFRIVGGKGNDTFDVKGNPRNLIYDLSFEDNYIISRNNTVKFFSKNPDIVRYPFREEIHSRFRFPRITAGFNPDDKFLFGVGVSFKTTGFRKYPYASRQRLSALAAVSRKAIQLRYGGEFNHIIRLFDLVLNADYYNPALNNFYGFGNETISDPAKPIEYYRTRFNYVSAEALLRKRFLNDSVLSISLGPAVYNYWYHPEPNQNRILENPAVVGLDRASVYNTKLYAGATARFTVNNLNSELVPVRGVNWTTDFTMMEALNNNASAYTRLLSSLDLYAELSKRRKLMAALHLGGGHIFSEKFGYFQALTLGSNNYLRGYRRNRFSGSSMLYASAELKYKLFDINTYLLKSDFGIVGFNDFGRVWMRNENSAKWHHAYGGGIYLIPYDSLMLSIVMGVSEEDKLMNISLGSKINIVY